MLPQEQPLYFSVLPADVFNLVKQCAKTIDDEHPLVPRISYFAPDKILLTYSQFTEFSSRMIDIKKKIAKDQYTLKELKLSTDQHPIIQQSIAYYELSIPKLQTMLDKVKVVFNKTFSAELETAIGKRANIFKLILTIFGGLENYNQYPKVSETPPNAEVVKLFSSAKMKLAGPVVTGVCFNNERFIVITRNSVDSVMKTIIMETSLGSWIFKSPVFGDGTLIESNGVVNLNVLKKLTELIGKGSINNFELKSSFAFYTDPQTPRIVLG